MDEQLHRRVDLQVNERLEQNPVYCEFKTDTIPMAFIHAHNGYELYMPCTAVGYCVVEGQEINFAPGTLLLIRPGAYHYIRSTQSVANARIVFTIDEIYWQQLHAQETELAAVSADWFRDTHTPVICLRVDEPGELQVIERLLLDLARELQNERKHGQLLIKAYLLELFVWLGRQSREGGILRSLMSDAHRRLMNEVADYLAVHCEEALSMDDLASRFFISRSQLFKLFKQFSGLTPQHYHLLQRLQRAKQLLSQTDETVTEISLRLGFNDLAYFSRRFKATTGVTPTEYRERGQLSK